MKCLKYSSKQNNTQVHQHSKKTNREFRKKKTAPCQEMVHVHRHNNTKCVQRLTLLHVTQTRDIKPIFHFIDRCTIYNGLQQ